MSSYPLKSRMFKFLTFRFNSSFLPGLLVFEPESVRFSQPLELLLDDGGKEGTRIALEGCLQHAADVDVNVVDVFFVDLLQLQKFYFAN